MSALPQSQASGSPTPPDTLRPAVPRFSALFAVLGLWRRRTPVLLAGIAVSLASLAAGIALIGAAGLHLAAAATRTGTLALGATAGALLAAPAGMRLIGLLRVLLRYAERLVTHAATFRALADLRVWFFRAVARGAAGGLGFARSGDLMARLVGDIESLDGLYLRILVPLLGALGLLPALVLLLGAHGAGLAAVIAVLFVLAAFVLPLLAARLARDSGAALTQANAALRVAVLDLIVGLREIRVFGAEGRSLATVQGREASALAAQKRLARRVALAGAGAFLCGQLALLSVLAAACGVAVLRTDPVYAVATIFLVIAAFEAVSGLPRAGALAGQMAAAAERVLAMGRQSPAVPEPEHPEALPHGSALRFEQVSFRWQPDRPPVLDDLSLDIPEGSRVAILGPSGAGKSSLAALALKVAAPQGGRVRLGGIDLARLDAASVRSRIAWLSQSTHLFDDSVRNNLLLGRPDASEAELWEALERAEIASLVRGLPDGLDSWLGEGGARVSGGQGRRLALARVLLSHAPVLILDEPCAGLDADVERAFLETLNTVTEGRTLILIVHRLVGVEKLDRIWRLSGGKAAAAAA